MLRKILYATLALALVTCALGFIPSNAQAHPRFQIHFQKNNPITPVNEIDHVYVDLYDEDGVLVLVNPTWEADLIGNGNYLAHWGLNPSANAVHYKVRYEDGYWQHVDPNDYVTELMDFNWAQLNEFTWIVIECDK